MPEKTNACNAIRVSERPSWWLPSTRARAKPLHASCPICGKRIAVGHVGDPRGVRRSRMAGHVRQVHYSLGLRERSLLVDAVAEGIG